MTTDASVLDCWLEVDPQGYLLPSAQKNLLSTIMPSSSSFSLTCFDCGTRIPDPESTWASVSLGVFLCMQCAGKHRQLGVHLSFVRSTSMDKLFPEQVMILKVGGNKRADKAFSNMPKPLNLQSPLIALYKVQLKNEANRELASLLDKNSVQSNLSSLSSESTSTRQGLVRERKVPQWVLDKKNLTVSK